MGVCVVARPTKTGIDYFPLDTRFIEDIKVRKIKREYKSDAICVLIYLLGIVYGEEGYYLSWDDDICFLVSDTLQIDEDIVRGIVNKALDVEFFDYHMYKTYRILTSKGIQNRYLAATERRQNTNLIAKYIIKTNELMQHNVTETGVNVTETRVNVTETRVNVAETGVNVDKSTQSKVKKSKVKESKENTIKDCNAPSAGRRGRTFTFESLVLAKYGNDESLLEAFKDFEIMRKSIKKPLTERAVKTMLTKLENLAGDDIDKTIKILEQSILNGWAGVFELKSGGDVFGTRGNDSEVRGKESQGQGKWDKYDWSKGRKDV